ncbi:LacI family DNA-binding transcriptional regulator [Microbacterium sp. NEAU-LLC]|uniref:LacI family DNA-binding transcriptional regulator n=1 Tax=Microbacterium helvum TaxID=2773713 RepID=A0ABR8NL82_9MICO|nr:LacI family DNA-binding transcriptional regulator [Microbacterium helvum]MBD3941434.1 LacI family DNA-binding transcriptional regulator [Microbacterium helvum]
MKNRRVTMQDVADRANVSKTAVSLAFNNSNRLAEATVKNILEAAAELGYSGDPAARMLRTRRTDSLGLLLPQQLDKVLENPYYTQFLQGIGQTCQREGFTLLLAPPLRGSMLKTIPYAAVDGFIVSGLEHDRGEVKALQQRGIPFVLVDSELHDDVPSVEIDDSEGMEELLGHLLSLGHRRIAIVAIETGTEGGYQNWRGPVLRRMQGAIAALASHAMAPESDGITVLEVPCTRAGGAAAFQQLWAQTERPTAIVAFSDIIALGVLDAARDADVAVPQEISVTGFDDLAEASWSSPSLTTIRQPIETKGRLAAEYLVESIAGASSARDHHQRLHTVLLVRDSTGPAPVR